MKKSHVLTSLLLAGAVAFSVSGCAGFKVIDDEDVFYDALENVLDVSKKETTHQKNWTINGDDAEYVKEGVDISIDFYEGEIIGITLPEKIEYKVIETTEAVKGNTTNNAQKDATIETGKVIKVPLFISEGENILVTTRDGKYAGRA